MSIRFLKYKGSLNWLKNKINKDFFTFFLKQGNTFVYFLLNKYKYLTTIGNYSKKYFIFAGNIACQLRFLSFPLKEQSVEQDI